MSFLNAEWRKLAMANYAIDPEILQSFVPHKTELDLWNNTCYASLVGFMFLNTKLRGIPVPFHRNFEEVNLRFYVRYKDQNEWKRGVVFIREIVPKPALSWVANIVYKEHYATMPMRHQWENKADSLQITYDWKCKGQWQSFSVNTEKNAIPIEVGSEAEFITEHYWGYSRVSDTKTFEYEVTHPKWEQYKVLSHQIDVDYGLVYGDRFAFINQLEPTSVLLAEGSAITVEGRKAI